MINSEISKRDRIKSKEAYIFDLDGVLVDSLDNHLLHMKVVLLEFDLEFVTALRKYLESVGKDFNYDNKFESYKHLLSIPDHFSVFYKNLGIDYEKNKDLIDEIFKDYNRPESLRFFNGIPELLSDVKSAGYKIGLVTSNYRDTVDEFLKKEDIEVFDSTIFSGEAESKPDPEGLNKCIKELKCEPSKAVFIGDAVSDALAAEAAGIDFIGVAYGYTLPGVLDQYPHIAIVDSPETLKNTLLLSI